MAKRAKAANVGPEPEEQQPSLPKLIENCLCLHLSGPIMCQACFLASVSSHVLTGSGFLHFPIMRFRVGAQRTSRRHPEPLRIRCHRLQTRVPALPSQLLFAQNCSVRGKVPESIYRGSGFRGIGIPSTGYKRKGISPPRTPSSCSTCVINISNIILTCIII